MVDVAASVDSLSRLTFGRKRMIEYTRNRLTPHKSTDATLQIHQGHGKSSSLDRKSGDQSDD